MRRVRASSVSCDVRAFRPQRLDDARRYENGIFVCPGNRRNGRFRKRMPKLGLCFPGVERQTLLEIKRFDESVASCLERFCALRPFGYTPVRQSINSAAAQLVSRRESRKIIFLITDGLCSDAELLTDIEQDLKRAGIEIVCLGIGDDIPKIFSIQSDIKHSRQMKEAAYKLLEETFRRRH